MVDYGYDALNRLATVTEQPSAALNQATAKVTRYGYTDVGSRASIEHPNGTRVDYVYNRRNQLTSMLHKKAATVLLGLSYLLNPDGSRASIIEHTQALDANQVPIVDASGAPLLEQQRRTDYQYDDLKRLVAETVDARVDANDRVTSWTYDAVGNRQTQSQQTGAGALAGTAADRASIAYTYDANDRLLSEAKTAVDQGTSTSTTTTHRYELNGSLLETAKPTTLERYRWNGQRQLIQHEQTSNGQTAITQYAYTADGIRNRIVANANTQNAITTRQLIDPVQAYAQVLEETVAQGNQPAQLKTVYTHGDDLIAQHALKNSDGTAATSGTSYLHYDGLGTTRFLTNATRAVTDRYVYQAFGDIDEAATTYAFGATAATDYLFTGEQYDPNLGFYYLRARYLDPTNGRFVSQDTYLGKSGDPASLHKYMYASANPTTFTDPSGMTTLAELGTTIRTVTTLSLNIVNSTYNLYNRVDDALTLFQVAKSLKTMLGHFPSPSTIVGDADFVKALQKSDDALANIGSNVHRIIDGIRRHKQEKIKGFLGDPKAQFVIFGPTPLLGTTPNLPDVKLGSLGLSRKSRRDIVFTFDTPKDGGGRFAGIGHRNQNSKNNRAEQWWRMDWHTAHTAPTTSQDSSNAYWISGGYHHHVK